MALGYDGKLYILAFDHRGSFQKKMFGIEGDPTPEETETISDAKKLIFEGMELAVERGVDAAGGRRAGGRAVRLDIPRARQGARPVADDAGREERPERVRLRVRRRLPGAHREVRPARSKVLVRYNPDGDAEMNERQLARLKELADWLHANDRKFLFELLVPAEHDAAGLRRRRHRPLRRRAAPGADAPRDRALSRTPASRSTSGRSRASTPARTPRCSSEQARKGEGRENVKSVLLGRGASDDKVDHWLRAGRAGRGLHRLRHRPLDLVGRAEVLPRRRSTARRRPSRSPTTTCASSRSTTRRRSRSSV